MRRREAFLICAVALAATGPSPPLVGGKVHAGGPHRGWVDVDGGEEFWGRLCKTGIGWCTGSINTATELAALKLEIARYHGPTTVLSANALTFSMPGERVEHHVREDGGREPGAGSHGGECGRQAASRVSDSGRSRVSRAWSGRVRHHEQLGPTVPSRDSVAPSYRWRQHSGSPELRR